MYNLLFQHPGPFAARQCVCVSPLPLVNKSNANKPYFGVSLSLSLSIFTPPIGQNGGRRPVHRPGRRDQAAQAARDHLGREAGQAQQRPDARPQDRERQQEFGLPAH